MTLVSTAAGFGAHAASRTQVTGFLREGERVTGVRATDLETGTELEIRAQQVVNATGVWTDEIQEMVGGRGTINVRASKGVHLVVPARPDPLRHRDHPADAGQRAVRDPVGPALDHRHHRHGLVPGQGPPGRQPHRHRLRARPGQQGPGRAAHQGRRRGRLRRAAAAAGRGVRVDLQAVPRARCRPPGARPGHDRRRQVHHLPGDGPGRGGRGRARPGREGRAVLHGHACRWPAPTATSRCGTAGTRWRGRPACTWPGSSTCCTGTAR